MTGEELQNQIGELCSKAAETLTPGDILLALQITVTQALVMTTLDVVHADMAEMKKEIEILKEKAQEHGN